MFNSRIRDNEYEFPTDRVVKQLIQQILTPIPSERPTLHEILFFTEGPVPSYIPTSAHDSPPDFSHISKGTIAISEDYAIALFYFPANTLTCCRSFFHTCCLQIYMQDATPVLLFSSVFKYCAL